MAHRNLPFVCLGLDELASPEVIRKQYKQLALRLHPDKCEDPRVREAFDAMASAYQKVFSRHS